MTSTQNKIFFMRSVAVLRNWGRDFRLKTILGILKPLIKTISFLKKEGSIKGARHGRIGLGEPMVYRSWRNWLNCVLEEEFYVLHIHDSCKDKHKLQLALVGGISIVFLGAFLCRMGKTTHTADWLLKRCYL